MVKIVLLELHRCPSKSPYCQVIYFMRVSGQVRFSRDSFHSESYTKEDKNNNSLEREESETTDSEADIVTSNVQTYSATVLPKVNRKQNALRNPLNFFTFSLKEAIQHSRSMLLVLYYLHRGCCLL